MNTTCNISEGSVIFKIMYAENVSADNPTSRIYTPTEKCDLCLEIGFYVALVRNIQLNPYCDILFFFLPTEAFMMFTFLRIFICNLCLNILQF